MPQHIGAHHERVAFARTLLTKKGRNENGAFSFEGMTLLEEAIQSGVAIRALFATQLAYDEHPRLRELESDNVPLCILEDRTFAKISDLENPSGILAIADLRLKPVGELLAKAGVTVVLADINDPGNAGTLLRSAEAFGACGVVFGNLGVEAYHPKVVRSAMGTVFRLPLASADPEAVRSALGGTGISILGLDAGGEPVGNIALEPDASWVLIIGHERHGLGRWESLCTRRAGVPMRGPTESLNAAVAGSIALYELAKSSTPRDLSRECKTP